MNNGRRGHREPLFLGRPANHAAKRAGGGTRTGIYLTNEARIAIGLGKVPSEDTTALSKSEIESSQKKAKLDVTVDEVRQNSGNRISRITPSANLCLVVTRRHIVI